MAHYVLAPSPPLAAEAVTDEMLGLVGGQKDTSGDDICHRCQASVRNAGADRGDRFLADVAEQGYRCGHRFASSRRPDTGLGFSRTTSACTVSTRRPRAALSSCTVRHFAPVPHVDVERDMCALTSESYGDGFANTTA